MEITANGKTYKVQAVVMLFDSKITKVQFNEISEYEQNNTKVIEIANGLVNKTEAQLQTLITDKIIEYYATNI